MSENKKSRWGLGIGLLISGFLLFMLILVAIASFQSFHLVEKDYYQKEIKYQDRIEQIKRTASLNKGVRINQDQSSRVLEIKFDEQHIGNNIEGDILFFRPSNANLDYTIPIEADDSGIQIVNLKERKAGLWRVKLEWVVGDSGYYYEDIIVLE